MKVWIDLSNSPHPLLFAPVARRLEELGHEVLITARDNAQTVELTRERWPDADVYGGSSPKSRPRKAAALGERIRGLRLYARKRRPDVALSHNSYAQIVAARWAGIPVVTAMDYEHQPANHLAFRLADTILLPQALMGSPVTRQGATETKVRWYPGLKEELYLDDFEPDPSVLTELGIERTPQTSIVVARTPPSRAIYHHFDNALFLESLRVFAAQPHVRCVVLTRYSDQRAAIRNLGTDNFIIPQNAVDSRSLLFLTDLMIGAGGTMTREAALMGVPTFTLFAGRVPRVDQQLEREGLLTKLESPSQLGAFRPGPLASGEMQTGAGMTDGRTRSRTEMRVRGKGLVNFFASTVEELMRK